MSKLTKKQKKMQEMLEGFVQPSTAVDAIKMGVIKDIYVHGGFTQSPFWIQLLADITGKKLHVTASADASAMGAAFMGMFATGHLISFAEVKKYIHLVSLYEPDAATHEEYKQLSALFDTLYPKLKESFSALSRLYKN